MLDSLTLWHQFSSYVEGEVFLKRMEVQGYTWERSNHGTATTKMRNLRLRYDQRLKRLTIKNSLHKYVRGINTDLFTFSDIQEANKDLCDCLGIEGHKLYVSYLEVAINLSIPTDPCDFLNKLVSYKSKPFYATEPRSGETKPLLFSAFFGEYRLKLYNASQYNHLTGKNILRYEFKFTKMRKLSSVLGFPKDHRFTLDEVCSAESVIRLADFLLRAWDRIYLEDTYSFKGLDINQAILLYAGQYTGLWPMLKQTYPKEYQAAKKKYVRLRAKAQRNETHSQYKAILQRTIEQVLGQ